MTDNNAPPCSPDELPKTLPVFPLTGVLLLPRGELPLNIFEKRYAAMVDDALKTNRLIGIIQPQKSAIKASGDAVPGRTDSHFGQSAPLSPLYRTGCAGRITAFSEIGNNRYMITLTGLCRFDVSEEQAPRHGYRRVRPDWAPFTQDIRPAGDLGLDRKGLKALLETYFTHNGLSCDWDVIDGTPDEHLITCLSMICPFDPEEKQALLEARCSRQRAEKFITMIRMAVHDKSYEGSNCH